MSAPLEPVVGISGGQAGTLPLPDRPEWDQGPGANPWWLHGPVIALLGMGGGLLAAILAHAPKKGLVAGLGVCLLLPMLLWLRGERFVPWLVVFGLGLVLPLNLRVNLLVENHVGGAPSITLTLTVLGVFLFWAVWLHRRLTGRIDTLVQVHRPIGLALLALLVLVIPSYVNAVYPKLFVLEWIRLALLSLGALAMMSLREERLVRAFFAGVSVEVVIQSGLALAQYALKRELGLGFLGEADLVFQNIGIVRAFRATGTLGHPNALAYFFEMLLPVMLALALTRQRPAARLWYGFALLCGLGGIFVTLTRGAWLTLPVTFTLVFVMVYGRRIVRAKALLMAALVAGALLAVSTYAWPIIVKRFTHTDYKSSGSRMPLNYAALSVIAKYPVAGIGLNNFAERFKIEDTTGHSRLFLHYKQLVHNMYLWIATETGVLGLIGYLGLFVVPIVVALRTAPRAPPVPRALLVGMAAGLMAHMQHGMFDPGFRVSLSNSYHVFFYAGLIGWLALQHGHKRSRWFARRAS